MIERDTNASSSRETMIIKTITTAKINVDRETSLSSNRNRRRLTTKHFELLNMPTKARSRL